MGVKRATNRTDEALMSRAVSLRLEGRSLRQIEAETGICIAALSVNFRDHPDLQDEAIAESIEDERTREDLAATAREANKAIRAVCKSITKRARAGEDEGLEKSVAGIASALDKALKLGRLLAGRPTAHTKSERTETMTPEEKAEMDRLQRLAGKGEFQ